MKKYELTNETIEVGGHTLHRIRALRSFGDVKEGDIGGFVERESGLSHESDALVYGSAQVYGSVRVKSCDHIFWISNIGSRGKTTSFFICEDKKVRVACGCFYGDLDEFLVKVKATHGDNRYAKVYRLAVEMATAHIVIPEGGEQGNG